MARAYSPQCPRCGYRYPIERLNAHLVMYRRQPWFDRLVSTCVKCYLINREFVEPVIAGKILAMNRGIRVYWHDFAGRPVVRRYEDEVLAFLRPSRRLSRRDEELVALFRVIIEASSDDLASLPVAWESDV